MPTFRPRVSGRLGGGAAGSGAGTAGTTGGQAAKAGAQQFKPFTSANFRENLGRLTGGIPDHAQAHHIFPQRFVERFERAGINIHEPRYGAWWRSGAHQKSAAAYNAEWRRFLDTSPSTEQILQFGRDLAREYGLTIHF